MNGILSDKPVGVLDPRSMALMQMGLGLMGGPSRTPVSFGQSLGQAGMQGLQAFQQTQKANQEQQLYSLKMADAQREAAERKQKQDAMAALLQDPRFAGMENLLRVAPSTAIERAYPKPADPNAMFSKVDPKDYTPESVTRFRTTGNYGDLVAAAKPQGPQSDLGKLEADYKAGLVSPEDYQAKRAKLTAPSQPLVNVDNRQENEFNKIVGAELGKQYSGLQNSAFSAPATISKYQRLGSLLGQVNTGKFKGATTDLKAAAKSVGIDLASLGITDDVAPAQAARALSSQLALELRNPAGGAGMPGAMSDKDRQFLEQMVPSLENDPAAIEQMIEYRVRLAKREQQVAKMARKYRQKNDGKFDEGFYEELAQWSERNPLFPEAGKESPMPQLSPKAQQYLNQAGAR